MTPSTAATDEGPLGPLTGGEPPCSGGRPDGGEGPPPSAAAPLLRRNCSSPPSVGLHGAPYGTPDGAPYGTPDGAPYGTPEGAPLVCEDASYSSVEGQSEATTITTTPVGAPVGGPVGGPIGGPPRAIDMDLEGSHGVEELNIKERIKGTLASIFSGLLGGISLGPMSFVPPDAKGLAFLPSFGIGDL